MTTAAQMINSLSPEQRALLFTALQYFINETETQQYNHLDNSTMAVPLQKMVQATYAWTISEGTELRKLLFGECFPEDLRLEPHAFKAVCAIKQTKEAVATVG